MKMKLPWKISFEEMDFASQIRMAMLIPLLPVIMSETLFFYLIIFAEWGVERAFSVSVMFCCLGIVAWYAFKDRVRRAITNFEPMTALLGWSKTCIPYENLLVRERIPLREEEILRPVKRDNGKPIFENHPTIEETVVVKSDKLGMHRRKTISVPIEVKSFEMGLNEVILYDEENVKNIRAGKYSFEVSLVRKAVAPNGIPFGRIQFIHSFPHQDDFFAVPDQMIVHNAQVLGGSGAVIFGIFLYWGERLEPIPVFLVSSSPQWVELVQQSIGMKPVLNADGENEALGTSLRRDIESTLTLGDTVKAMTYAQLLEGRTKKLEGMLEHNYTVEDQAIGLFGTWQRNREIITEARKYQWLKNKKMWLYIGIGLLILAGIWWIIL